MQCDILIHLKHFVESIWRGNLLRPSRPREIPAHHEREGIFLLPLHKGIKIVALVINKEIWEWPVCVSIH
jgi:hypothetical protein